MFSKPQFFLEGLKSRQKHGQWLCNEAQIKENTLRGKNEEVISKFVDIRHSWKEINQRGQDMKQKELVTYKLQ